MANKERSEAQRRQQLEQQQNEEHKRLLLAERQKRIEEQREQRRRLEEVTFDLRDYIYLPPFILKQSIVCLFIYI